MSKHETKLCPRCRQSFVCKVGDVMNCQCNEVQLSEQTIAFIGSTQYECLCKDCLQKINNLVERAKAHHFPTQKEMLVEGLHYYQESDNWVFTELYHYLRGNCCGNGCRHCVYGNAAK